MLRFFSVRLRAMPYRHLLFAPMMHEGDDHLARVFLFGRLYGRGSLLFHLLCFVLHAHEHGLLALPFFARGAGFFLGVTFST